MNDKDISASETIIRLRQELQQKEAELEAANKSIESLSYTISHDLRAPLRTMDSFSQALTEDYATHLPEEATNYLNRVRKACTQMRNMIDELLELARVTRRNLKPQEFNISNLVTDIINEIKISEPEKQVTVEIQNNLKANADKHLLRIALHHLMHNAWKFASKNDNPTIQFTCSEKNNETIYCVADNGIGFDMSYYDQLFEPFKRLHSSDEFSGIGIGLATAQRIIERHGGKLWAESEPEEGAKFYFTLAIE